MSYGMFSRFTVGVSVALNPQPLPPGPHEFPIIIFWR
jgi:hypothetical protein